MSNLADYINDIILEAMEIKAKALEKQSQQLDDDMQQLDEIEAEMAEDLKEEYLHEIKNRLIGE